MGVYPPPLKGQAGMAGEEYKNLLKYGTPEAPRKSAYPFAQIKEAFKTKEPVPGEEIQKASNESLNQTRQPVPGEYENVDNDINGGRKQRENLRRLREEHFQGQIVTVDELKALRRKYLEERTGPAIVFTNIGERDSDQRNFSRWKREQRRSKKANQRADELAARLKLLRAEVETLRAERDRLRQNDNQHDLKWDLP